MHRRLIVPLLAIGLLAVGPASNASHQEGPVDLRVVQAGTPDPVVEGGHVTYSIDVSNPGAHPADRVELTEVVSDGTIVAASGRKWECGAPQGARVSCVLHGALPELTAADQLTVVAQAPVDGASLITATATGLARGVEQNPADNVSQVTTEVGPGTELGVSMFDTPDPVTAQASVRYGISVTNHGDVAAQGVTVTHQVSAGVPASWFGDGWTCQLGSASATCTLAGDLGVGASASELSVVVRAPETGSEIHAVASVSAANTVSPTDAEETTQVQPLGQDSATGYIPPEGGCLTTNPGGQCTTVGGLDALSASAASPDSGATPANDTFGDVRFGPGPGGVASLFEGSAKLAVCAAVDPIDPADCAGAALDVIVPPGYDDPASPIEVNLVYDLSVAPTAEDPRTVYMEKPIGGTPVTTVLTQCSLLGVASPSPCVDFQERIAGDDLLIRILMLSQDPKYQG